MRPRVLKCLLGNYLFSANVFHREYVVALFDMCFQQMCDYKYILPLHVEVKKFFCSNGNP